MESVCSGDLLLLKLCILEGCQEGKIPFLLFHCQVLALRSHSQDWAIFSDAQVVKRHLNIILLMQDLLAPSAVFILWSRSSCACLRCCKTFTSPDFSKL